MIIIEDSRQQAGRHELKHKVWDGSGDVIYRSKLAVGDYCLPPEISVDTKASMQEIAQNIGGTTEEHERFRRELILAKDLGIKLYVLIENTEGIRALEEVAYWVNPRLAVSPKAITGPRLRKAMSTMQERYGVTFLFCSPSEAADIIKSLLRKEGGDGNNTGRLDKAEPQDP